MKILFLGDIVGNAGIKVLENHIGNLRNKYKPNLIIVNGENATKGKGLNLKDYKRLMSLNISCITMGNHTYRQKEINDFIDEAKIVRPANIIGQKGLGYKIIKYNDKSVAIINLIGSFNMKLDFEIENPFIKIDELLKEIVADYIVVDFHAEATSEKLALAYMLDGKVAAVVGTHTHIQTNDARILDKGTLYITDLGMCGSYDSIIGVKKDIIINRFKDNDLSMFELEDKGKMIISGVLLDLDNKKCELVKEII